MFESWSALFPTASMAVMMVLAAVLGGTMRAFSGFGGGLLLAPVFSLYLPPQEVVALVVLLNFLSTFQMLPGIWKDIDWPLVWRMLPAALAGVPLGWWLLNGLDPHLVRRLVAVVVITLSAILLTGWVYKGTRGRLQDAVAGVTSGALTSIAGIGGPPFILYMLAAPGYSPASFRTFFTVFFLFTQTLALSLIFISGDFGAKQAAYLGILLPVYMLATALGTYLFLRALRDYAHQIKRISLWFLLAVGVVILVL
jgi:uncharacterized protein